MKFANINDAIMEAAKKPAAKPAPKTAAKKVEPKKAPAKPAPKPAAKRTPAKPAAKSAAKKTGNKKRVVTPPPAPETDDKGTENKGAEEKPTQEKPAETKPTQSADSGEPRKFAPRWLQSKPRGIGDRLKTAWKGFTAKAGDKIDVPHKYKSVFHEIQKLMEQLQLVESMLREQSLNESYDAGTVNNLYAHRNAIRSVLVEQIVREELYQHNVTIAELDQRQRAALMETVTVRANALWEGLEEAQVMAINPDLQAAIDRHNERRVHNTRLPVQIVPAVKVPATSDDTDDDVDEGRFTRLAAGLGLAGAAMMGGAKDAGAQGVVSPQDSARVVNTAGTQGGPAAATHFAKRIGDINAAGRAAGDSVQTGTGNDLGMAQKRAYAALQARNIVPAGGQRHDFVQNPDGTYSFTVNARGSRPAAPQMEEQYTLEEWMGMMEEAGYSLSERNKENKAAKDAWVRSQGQQQGGDRINQTLAARASSPTSRYSADAQATKIGRSLGDRQTTDRLTAAAQQVSRANPKLVSPSAVSRDQRDGRLQTGVGAANWQSPEMHRAVARGQQGADQADSSRSDTAKLVTTQGDRQRRAQNTRLATGQTVGQVKSPQVADDPSRDPVKLQQHLQARKAQMSVDRAARGASVPGTVDFARDKMDAQDKARRAQQARMAAESINENTVARLQSLAGIKPTE